jgi:exopolyphosphatase/guanosine-5'-triphosphate,3'-diphosphate pyrophosphatase
MASILRVADALDRGHSQHIKTISFERRGESIVIHTRTPVLDNSEQFESAPLDTSLERAGIEEKAGMFQDVFGYKIVIN